MTHETVRPSGRRPFDRRSYWLLVAYWTLSFTAVKPFVVAAISRAEESYLARVAAEFGDIPRMIGTLVGAFLVGLLWAYLILRTRRDRGDSSSRWPGGRPGAP